MIERNLNRMTLKQRYHSLKASIIAWLVGLSMIGCAGQELSQPCGFDPRKEYSIRTLPNGSIHPHTTIKDLITGPDAEDCTDSCDGSTYTIVCSFETYTFHDAMPAATGVDVTMTRKSDGIGPTFNLSEACELDPGRRYGVSGPNGKAYGALRLRDLDTECGQPREESCSGNVYMVTCEDGTAKVFTVESKTGQDLKVSYNESTLDVAEF
jgi:hypothetical protein